MGDVGEDFNDYKEERRSKKYANAESSKQMLTDRGVRFKEHTQWHLAVEGRQGIIDFWPSTGKWLCQYDGGSGGRGIHSLLNEVLSNG